LDTTNDTWKTLGDFSTTNRNYRGAALAPNGALYAIPTDAPEILKIQVIEGNVPINYCLSPFFNKP
jgi:hypothetical protein